MIACFTLPQLGIACERTRLTDLWGMPVGLVLDDGMLSAVSDEAVPYGVRPGEPASGARSLCPSLTILPYDRPAYEEAARRVWDLFAIESSVVEPVSPEVCYVEMTGRDVQARVQWLAGELARSVRVPVNVGVGRTKFVAFQAALQSRESIITVPVGSELAALAHVPLTHIPKLDRKLRQRLERLGVRTLGDVAKLPPSHLRKQARDVGYLLERLAAGQDGDRVKPLWPPPRIEHALDFEEEVSDFRQVHEALLRCANTLAAKLPAQYTRSMTLTVSLADNSALQETERLVCPTNSAGGIYRAALRLLGRMTIDSPLTGIALQAAELGAGSGVQLALLDGNDWGQGLPHERKARLEATLTYLRKRFGVGAVIKAAMLRQARRIGLWTYPLGHSMSQPVTVETDRKGVPVRYWRRGQRRDVKRIQNRWKEIDWFWGSCAETTVYRIETSPTGLSELHKVGVQWRLKAVAD